MSREDQLRWIVDVVATRRQADERGSAAPTEPLFSDAQVRILAWFGGRHDVWMIDRADQGKPDVVAGFRPSAAEIAAATHTSVRTVREALHRAAAGGFLIADAKGGGRGKRARYILAQPPSGWRHKMGRTAVRRQSRQRRAAIPA